MRFSHSTLALLITVAAAAPAPQGNRLPPGSLGNSQSNNNPSRFGASFPQRNNNPNSNQAWAWLQQLASQDQQLQFLLNRQDVQQLLRSDQGFLNSLANAKDPQTAIQQIQNRLNNRFGSSFDPNQFDSDQFGNSLLGTDSLSDDPSWTNNNNWPNDRRVKRSAAANAPSPQNYDWNPDYNWRDVVQQDWNGQDPNVVQLLRSAYPNWSDADESSLESLLDSLDPDWRTSARQDPTNFLNFVSLLQPDIFTRQQPQQRWPSYPFNPGYRKRDEEAVEA